MSKPTPVYLGQYGAVLAGDIVDLAIDVAGDLDTGETLSSVTFTVTNAAGTVQAGAVTASTVSSPKVSYRLAVPSTADTYTITAVCTLSDSQKITHTAEIRAV